MRLLPSHCMIVGLQIGVVWELPSANHLVDGVLEGGGFRACKGRDIGGGWDLVPRLGPAVLIFVEAWRGRDRAAIGSCMRFGNAK